MSFSSQLAVELKRLGCTPSDKLVYALPKGPGPLEWWMTFRALGFAKNQIDGALRYRHPRATPFGWFCLRQFAGSRWSHLPRTDLETLSGGCPIGQVAGWQSNFMLGNKGLSAEESAIKIALDVQSRVLPYIAGLQSNEDLLALLTQDEEPFPWYRSQPLTRIAEIATLTADSRERTQRLTQLAADFGGMLQNQLDGVEVVEYISNVLMAAAPEA